MFKILGDRLTVGLGPLKPAIMVRIHVPQPSFAKATEWQTIDNKFHNLFYIFIIMNDLIVWLGIFIFSIIFGFLSHKAKYNKEIDKENNFYKFLEFYRHFVNYLLAFIIAYYFISYRFIYIVKGDNFTISDIILGIVFIIGVLGWLPYFVKNITEGISVIFKKILG